MEVIYTNRAKKDIFFWQNSGNKIILKKIELLIEDIMKNPFSGLGKPEALKHEIGFYSRRISQKDRIVYEVLEEEGIIYVYRLRGHYKDK